MQSQHAVPVFGRDFNALMTFLRDDAGPTLSPVRYGLMLQLDAQTLAQIVQVHRNTLRLSPTSPPIQEFLRDAVRVLCAATDLQGDVEAALFWFSNHPLREFEYKTAQTLVSERKTVALLRYLDSLGAGFAG